MFGRYTKAIVTGLSFAVAVGQLWIDSGAPPVITAVVGAIGTILTLMMANRA